MKYLFVFRRILFFMVITMSWSMESDSANHADDESSVTRIKIKLEIPSIKTDAYFRPYIAVWLESKNRQPINTLALWYQIDSAANQEDGGKWLKDLRQWWRKIGKKEMLDYDSVTGATRRPGKHNIAWQAMSQMDLAPGDYFLNFEAAREEGGRTFHRVPIVVKSSPFKQTINLSADNEFGEISIFLESQL